MDVLEDKKEKKKFFLLRRKKRDQFMMAHLRHIEQDQERVELQKETLRAPAAETPRGDEAMTWSAKTQEIRNKMSGKKRMAGERWNRFAGTEDGGGRGL